MHCRGRRACAADCRKTSACSGKDPRRSATNAAFCIRCIGFETFGDEISEVPEYTLDRLYRILSISVASA